VKISTTAKLRCHFVCQSREGRKKIRPNSRERAFRLVSINQGTLIPSEITTRHLASSRAKLVKLSNLSPRYRRSPRDISLCSLIGLKVKGEQGEGRIGIAGVLHIMPGLVARVTAFARGKNRAGAYSRSM